MTAVKQRTNLPPGTMGRPGIGEMREFSADPVAFLWDRYRRYGRIFKTQVGEPVIFMIGPEANRFMLHDQREIFSWGKAAPKYLRLMFGDLPMAMKDGEPYRRIKTIVARTVAQDMLRSMFDSMVRAVERHVHQWTQWGSIVFYPRARDLIHEVSVNWLLGDAGNDQERERMTALWHDFADMPEGVRDMPPAPGGSRFARGDDKQDSLRRRVAARYEIEALMRNAIARRVELPLADAVSLMCQGRDGRTETSLSDEELIAQSMMMLAGGDDTTSALATWFFVELGRSPEALTALSNEIDAVIGDGPLTYDAVNSMTYLDCVIKEIERMHSPTLGGVRTVLRQFEFDGYTVPQGWTVRNCAVLSHYLPEVFKDPERFDPARFAPPRSEDVKTPYGLIAFGAGPRHCTGRNFAKLFMRILAIVSVRNAYWTLVPGQDLTPVLDRVFKPRSRLEINFIGRSVATAQTPKPASRTR